MSHNTPDEVVAILDAAFNAGDLEAILAHYETDALVVPEPGTAARGVAAIRTLYGRVMQPGLSATQERVHVLTAGGLALFTSRWTSRAPDGAAASFVSNVVLRAQADGSWKVVIDNARGPMVLDEATDEAKAP